MNPICKVLIVDDEILVRQGIKYVLDWEQEGFQIVGEAANGREALNSLQTLQPHIIITDIVMPVMDGEELTRLVKRDYPATEVIVLSSFSEFHYVRSTFQHGVADYILKPKLEAGALLQVLKRPGNASRNSAAGDRRRRRQRSRWIPCSAGCWPVTGCRRRAKRM